MCLCRCTFLQTHRHVGPTESLGSPRPRLRVHPSQQADHGEAAHAHRREATANSVPAAHRCPESTPALKNSLLKNKWHRKPGGSLGVSPEDLHVHPRVCSDYRWGRPAAWGQLRTTRSPRSPANVRESLCPGPVKSHGPPRFSGFSECCF